MSKWQTVNEALDLILDRGPGEDENKEPEEAAAEEEVIVNVFREQHRVVEGSLYMYDSSFIVLTANGGKRRQVTLIYSEGCWHLVDTDRDPSVS